MQHERHLLLSITVFCCGAVVLILEILGSRLLAPFFGSTQYVWSSLIAVTLLALSVGYAVGGRLADRTDPFPALYRTLVMAGWLILLIPLIRTVGLPATAALGLRAGALAAALLLLALPLALLGCVAPLAAKTAVSALSSLGLRVGGLYALSTVGSLAGALATGFLLIPLLGVSRILLLSALLLFVPALWFWFTAPWSAERLKWRVLAAAGAALCLVGQVLRPEYPLQRRGSPWMLLSKTDSRYGEVKVVEYRTSRTLMLDGALQTGIDTSNRLSLFSYVAGMTALLKAAHPAARRVLLVGFGGGVLTVQLVEEGFKVESVEIDPAVAQAARRFFTRSHDLPVALEDGRTFLLRAPPGSYDAVILDAYAGEAPPAHLFTVEAYRLVKRVLSPGGVGLVNLISIPFGPHGRLTRSVGRTIRTVFPWVEAYALQDEEVANVLFVFADRPRAIHHLPSVRAYPQVAEEVQGMLARKVDLTLGDGIVLTDEYNPIESMNVRAREKMRRHLQELIPAWLLLE